MFEIICQRSTISHLTAEKLRRLRVPDVGPKEQRGIARYLDKQTAKIDTVIAETERFIELSKERRSALITAAVTDQIDVRESPDGRGPVLMTRNHAALRLQVASFSASDDAR
jgi:type I restriction enzyme, S subunit